MSPKLLRYLTIMATLAISITLAMSASAGNSFKARASAQAVSESPNGIYIVQMIDNPAVAYDGGVKGLKATRPARGKKLDPESKHVIDYVSHLKGIS